VCNCLGEPQHCTVDDFGILEARLTGLYVGLQALNNLIVSQGQQCRCPVKVCMLIAAAVGRGAASFHPLASAWQLQPLTKPFQLLQWFRVHSDDKQSTDICVQCCPDGMALTEHQPGATAAVTATATYPL